MNPIIPILAGIGAIVFFSRGKKSRPRAVQPGTNGQEGQEGTQSPPTISGEQPDTELIEYSIDAIRDGVTILPIDPNFKPVLSTAVPVLQKIDPESLTVDITLSQVDVTKLACPQNFERNEQGVCVPVELPVPPSGQPPTGQTQPQCPAGFYRNQQGQCVPFSYPQPCQPGFVKNQQGQCVPQAVPADPGEQAPSPFPPIPANNAYCAPIVNWSPDFEAAEAELLTLLNAERAKVGLPPLEYNPQLACAARAHAVDIAQRKFFDHVNPDGENFTERITKAGYTWNRSAENLGMGYPTAAMQINGWMNSPGHRENVLASNVNEAGPGVYSGWKGPIWAMTFGRRN